jgi:hypothetical protein
MLIMSAPPAYQRGGRAAMAGELRDLGPGGLGAGEAGQEFARQPVHRRRAGEVDDGQARRIRHRRYDEWRPRLAQEVVSPGLNGGEARGQFGPEAVRRRRPSDRPRGRP